MRHFSFATFLACTAVFACDARAADPVTTAIEGYTAGKVLDKANNVATNVLGVAASNSSLVLSKGARDVELLIANARQQLHDELDTQFKKLNVPEQNILREVDAAVARLDQLGTQVAHIQDAIVLDVDGELSKLPFAKSTPVVRRVEGASVYYRRDGLYRVHFTTNLTSLALHGVSAKLDGVLIPAAAVTLTPPYSVVVLLPASALHFNQKALSYATLELDADVKNDRGIKVWKPAERPVRFQTKMELFPIQAITYTLTEWRTTPTVQRDRLMIAKGQDHSVKGCGNSGCNDYHPFCVDVPSGAVPVDYINMRDSFSGWGGWSPSRVEGTQVCATYWQHSHDQTRNVGFDARYYPLEDVRSSVQVPLTAITAGSPPPNSTTTSEVKGATGSELGATYNAFFSKQYASYDLAVHTFTGETIVATPSQSPTSPIVKVSPVESSGAAFKRITVGFQLPW